MKGSATVTCNESKKANNGVYSDSTLTVGSHAKLIAYSSADSKDGAIYAKNIDSNFYHADKGSVSNSKSSYVTVPQYGVVYEDTADNGYDYIYDKIGGTLQTYAVIQGEDYVKPSAVVISAKKNDKTNIALSWEKVANEPLDNGTAAENTYVVYRSTNATSGFTEIGTTTTGAYTDTALDPDTTYYYYVLTTNGYFTKDNAIKSNVANATTAAIGTTAASKLSNTNHSTISVSWDAVSGATGYKIYRADSKEGTYSLVATITNGSTTWTLKDEKAYLIGNTYYFKVAALETLNNKTYEGTKSAASSIKVLPCTPNMTVTKKSRKITLKWSRYACVTKWQIKVNGKIVKTIAYKKATHYTFKGKKGQTYKIAMRSYKTVNGVKVYSKWTKTKTIKIK